jgi:hypothetical protein
MVYYAYEQLLASRNSQSIAGGGVVAGLMKIANAVD